MSSWLLTGMGTDVAQNYQHARSAFVMTLVPLHTPDVLQSAHIWWLGRLDVGAAVSECTEATAATMQAETIAPKATE